MSPQKQTDGIVGETCPLFDVLSSELQSPGSAQKVLVNFEDHVAARLLEMSRGADLALFILFASFFKLAVSRYTAEIELRYLVPDFSSGRIAHDAELVVVHDTALAGSTFGENAIESRTSFSKSDASRSGDARALSASLPVLSMSNLSAGSVTPTAGQALAIMLCRDGDRLSVKVTFDCGRLSSEMVERFVRHLERLVIVGCRDIKGIAGGVDTLSSHDQSAIEMLSAGESHPIPHEILHSYVEAQAARTPDVIAIIAPDGTRTYAELVKEAAIIAGALGSIGIGPSDRVAVALPRSLALISAILGVLKAGAAFVPLNLADPQQRIRTVVDSAAPRLIIGDPATLGDLGADIMSVGQLAGTAIEPKSPVASVGGEDPAYIIFTSGSTGRPKGVEVLHRGISNSVEWRRSEYSAGAGAPRNVMLVFPPGFDAFVLNLFSPLASGDLVIMPDDDEARSPEAVRNHIRDHRVELITIGPALFGAVLAVSDRADLVSLRRLTLAGDRIEPGLPALIAETCPGIVISNEYGPTENSVVSTWARELAPGRPNVIGRPIANTTVNVLDAERRRQPIGVEGEIVLGGVGLATGYLGGTERGSGGFFEWNGARHYATGDRGRWLADGQLEFLGRIDSQVSLRGYRIELGEIEENLKALAGIEDAVVFLVGEKSDQRIAGCIVSRHRDPDDVLADLGEVLPQYMIPRPILRIPKLPLAESGKYDIAQLRSLVAAAQRAGAAPEWQSPTERRLAEIWKEVLEVSDISPEDNFFSLGGHSLKATSLLSHIAQRFQVDISLRQVFDTTTLRQLAQAIDAGQGVTPARRIGRSSAETHFPVSAAQERMLALASEGTNNLSYVVSVVFEATTDIAADRLQRALDAVVARHDSLRTQFAFLKDRAIQTVLEHCTIPLMEINLHAGRELPEVLAEEFAAFDLEVAPLARAGIVAGSAKTYLILSFHHAIVDEASLDFVLSDLSRAYDGLPLENATQLTYADYASWEGTFRKSPDYDEAISHWRHRLGKRPLSPVNLPYDGPGDGRLARGSQEVVSLGAELSRRIRDVCRRIQATEFSFFLAAVSVVLARLGRQSSVLLAVPVSQRLRPELQEIVGLFLNTLIMPVDIDDGTATFEQLLKAVGANLKTDLSHAEAQLNDVLREIGWSGDKNFSDVFNVMLSLVARGRREIPMGDARLDQVDVHNGSTKFHLSIEVRDLGDSYELAFEYDTTRFHRETINRIVGCIEVLVANIVLNPSQSIADLALITPQEQERLLRLGDAMAGEHFSSDTVISMFEAQAASRPSAVAIEAANGTISYGELNAWANGLAQVLAGRGVKGGTVAILCDRTWQNIGCMLAVQKIGAAYVPIDPKFPQERARMISELSGAHALLTDRDDSAAFGLFDVIIRVDREEFAALSAPNPECALGPEDLCYVLFTSGTTGVPKGVMIEHRNVVNLVVQSHRHFAITSDDAFSQFHSTCFDVSVWEIYGALLSGGRLVLLPAEVQVDPAKVLEWVLSRHVTILCQVPSAFYLLSEEMLVARSSGAVRCVILAGEALKPYRLKTWHKAFPHLRLINSYGITETTINSTYKDIDGESFDDASASIGRPFPSGYIQILDDRRDPVPEGIVGELYVGGLGVARGYLNDAAKTAEKFLVDPHNPSQRVYRSGDLGKWLPNGEIVYVSRADHQVKVRGFRIETAEIERTIAGYGHVRDAIVVSYLDSRQDTRLAAYFTSARQEEVAGLKRFILEKLPAFMLPAHLLQLPEMPLSPNGKIDRRRLPDPAEHLKSRGTRLAGANEEMENAVAEIWAETLSIDRANLNPEDSLFDIGGDSISASFIVRKLKNEGHDAVVSDIFKCDTIRTLAKLLTDRHRARQPADKSRVTGRVHPATSAHFNLKDPALVESAWGDLEGSALLRYLLATLGTALHVTRQPTAVDLTLPHQSEGKKTVPLSLQFSDIHDVAANVQDVAERLSAALHRPQRGAVPRGPAATRICVSLDNQHLEPGDETLWVACTIKKPSSLEIQLVTIDPDRDAASLSTLLDVFRLSMTSLMSQAPSIRPGKAAALPPRIVLDIEPFDDVFFRDCRNQGVVAAARFFAGSHLPLIANTNAYFKMAGEVEYTFERPETDLLAQLGISLEELPGSPDLIADLQSDLAAGFPVLVDFDWYAVPSEAGHYRKKHRGHTALVHGYDAQAGLLDVIANDTFVGLAYRRFQFPFAVLEAAHSELNRQSNSAGNAMSYATIVGARGASRFTARMIEELAELAMRNARRAHGLESHTAVQGLAALARSAARKEVAPDEAARRLSYFAGEALNARKIDVFKLETIGEWGSMLAAARTSADAFETARNILLKAELAKQVDSSLFDRVFVQFEKALAAEEELTAMVAGNA